MAIAVIHAPEQLHRAVATHEAILADALAGLLMTDAMLTTVGARWNLARGSAEALIADASAAVTGALARAGGVRAHQAHGAVLPTPTGPADASAGFVTGAMIVAAALLGAVYSHVACKTEAATINALALVRALVGAEGLTG